MLEARSTPLPLEEVVQSAGEGASPADNAPAPPPSPTGRGRTSYWQAQGVAELALSQFDTGLTQDDRAAERQAFYTLAHYYQRTRTIVRQALTSRREPLAQAALRNLVVLHRPLT